MEDSSGCSSTITSKAWIAVGLETFVPCRLPDYYDQELRAKAVTYCEMWYIPTDALLAMCDVAIQLRCAHTATQLLGSDTSRLALASALRTCPCFAGVSEAAITAVAQALQARVYWAGDTIVASKRSPRTGILVVAGMVFVHSDKKTPPQRLCTGQSRYFFECFVKMVLEESVVSQSNSIVLHGSPGIILELMEELKPASDDIKIMLDSAQEYVNGRYGTGASDLSKAQNAAAERVRDFKRRFVEAASTASPPGPNIDTIDTLALLENELLVSPTVQLQALHLDTTNEAKFGVLLEGQVAIGDDDAPSKFRPTAECFSLDDEGKLLICTSPAPIAPAHPLTGAPATPSVFVFAPKTDVVTASLQQRGRTKKKACLSTGDSTGCAAIAVHASVPATIEQRRVPSPRLTVLHTTATRPREEANDVDRRREQKHQLLRLKHSL
ncbi:hypothetical protein Q4I28_002005 [Leishmania naiffi]|uniref:Cyclic nucleotide-binding domain-containing protein n=1 Tax=Leishmania naiffi TaxID=5678 RepID=A0AAW3C1Q8_9TRYP